MWPGPVYPPPLRAVGEDTNEGFLLTPVETDTLDRTVVDRCDNQENLVWDSLLQIQEEGVCCSPNVRLFSYLVLGTSLHLPAN